MKNIKTQSLVLLKRNPRTIEDDKYSKLKDSIKEFPEMLNARPIVVNQNMEVLGGNMRVRAALELGIETLPCTVVDWNAEQQNQFIIKDNIGYGQWDWDVLANEWDAVEMQSWGLDVWSGELEDEAENPYTKKIVAPTYQPTEENPLVEELYDNNTTQHLIEKINAADIDETVKAFLLKAAERHTAYDYSKIADFYSHADSATQNLMEESALVIIDFDRAIELGYVRVNEEIVDQYLDEHGE